MPAVIEYWAWPDYGAEPIPLVTPAEPIIPRLLTWWEIIASFLP